MSLLKMERDFFIYTKDVDMNDIIKPHAVLEIFQDMAALHAIDLGCGYEVCKQNNMAWILLYNKVEIVKPPKYFKNYKVKTWPKPNRRIEYNREYLMVNENDEPLIKGISNWAVINYETRSIVRKGFEFEGEYVSETNYIEPAKRKLELDENNFNNYFEYKTSADDLDHNGHVNNTRYLKMIYDFLNLQMEQKYINYIEIAYIKEARFEEIIKIGYNKISDNKYEFIGYVNNEKCFEAIIGVEYYE